jgi:uncharacterized protein (TIGR00730 family)
MGTVLGERGYTIVYGGGRVGSMGHLADAGMAAGGEVVGVIPRFMMELEWQHPGLSDLIVVKDLRERKKQMIEGADAIVALPGGSGTLEELFEAITLKRLGLFLGPIVLVSTAGFFEPLVEQLDSCVDEGFMDRRHRDMWQVVEEPAEVLKAFRTAREWSEKARRFAAL